MAPNIKDFYIGLIEATKNPLAPQHVERGAEGITSLRKLFIPLSTLEKTTAISDRLLKDFSDEELKQIANTPDFIIALNALLYKSLIDYITNTVRRKV